MNNPTQLRKNISMMQGKKSCTEMGKMIGFSCQTFSKRAIDPYSMTLYEVIKLCQKCHVSVEDYLTKELKLQ